MKFICAPSTGAIATKFGKDWRRLESATYTDAAELSAIGRTHKAYCQQLEKARPALIRIRHNIGAHQSPLGADSPRACNWTELLSLWATDMKLFLNLLLAVVEYYEAASRLSTYEWFRQPEDGIFEFVGPLVIREHSSA